MGLISDTLKLRTTSKSFRRASEATDSLKDSFPRIDEDSIAPDFNFSSISDEQAMEAYPDATDLAEAKNGYLTELAIRARPEGVTVEQRIIDLLDGHEGSDLLIPTSLRRNLMAIMDEDAVEQVGLERVSKAHQALFALPDKEFLKEMADKKTAVYELRRERLGADPEMQEKLNSFVNLSLEDKRVVLEFLADTYSEVFDLEKYKIIFTDKELSNTPDINATAGSSGKIRVELNALGFSLDAMIKTFDHELDHLMQFEMIKSLPDMDETDPKYNMAMMMAANLQVIYLRAMADTPFDIDYYGRSPMEFAAYLMNNDEIRNMIDWNQTSVPDFEERVPPYILTPEN